MTDRSERRLEERVALITGASRGIGAAVARHFSREGAHVILVARTTGDLEAVDDSIQADGGTATLVPLDLAEFTAIDQMAAAIAERFGRLDVLVGNAAVLGALAPVGHWDPDMWERAFAVNVTANWRLIRAFDPLLRASVSGRAIFVTSGLGSRVIPYYGAYSASKAALNMLVETYAAEVAKTSLRVNLIDPGIVRTALRAEAFPGEDPAGLTPPEAVTEAFVRLAEAGTRTHGEIVRA
ncbi:MAG: SDR family NAD(P)-dependent oxidoreductase [Alphaproteobacteria bacterium]|nr:SDR family NAD(P)-dependent oxidoreductase [Alphaproteobacteria bacterium]